MNEIAGMAGIGAFRRENTYKAEGFVGECEDCV